MDTKCTLLITTGFNGNKVLSYHDSVDEACIAVLKTGGRYTEAYIKEFKSRNKNLIETVEYVWSNWHKDVTIVHNGELVGF